jgi:hypothetical protein
MLCGSSKVYKCILKIKKTLKKDLKNMMPQQLFKANKGGF